MDSLRKDIKYAVRSLIRQPGFTIVTILTLALGIGANTAVFSVVNGVLLRPLPYPQAEQLEYITSQFPGLGFNQFWVSPPEFVEFRDHNRVFSSVGAFSVGAANLGTAQPTRPVRALVTSELMPVLAVPAFRGRWFTAADSLPNAPPVAILSWELWQRSYGGREDLVGQTVQINNVSNEIVGILPRGYDIHDQKVELWQPLTLNPAAFANQRGNHGLYLVGRRKDGVSHAQALADLERLLGEWPKTIAPGTHAPNNLNPQSHRLRIDPLQEDIVGGVRQALIVLQVAVVFVLLIACANLANLLVARAESRMREYAVRTALGATRLRLFRQLLTEGFVLTFVAALAGVALAYAGLQALLVANPDAIPRTAEIGVDRRVLGFTLLVAIVTGLIFALVPLMHLGVVKAAQAFREAGTRTTAGKARLWFRSALVVGEVALAVTLVVGAGLLIRSFLNLTRVDMGFNRSELSTFGLVLPPTKYTPPQRVEFFRQLTTRLQSVPGVKTVSAMSGLPPLRNVNANDTDFEHIPNNRPPGEGPAENVDFYQYVTAGYVETMGIPVVAGRGFAESDLAGAAVAMINETLAKRFFAGRDPIGGRVRPTFNNTVGFLTVVGVLKDVKQGGIAEAAGTELYMLSEQMPKYQNFAPTSMNIVVRSTMPLSSLAPEYRKTVQELDATVPLIRLRSMDDVVGDAIARPRFLTVLLGIFAGLALVLAAVGTYGILAYLVSERKQEIGIRMALGADRSKVLRLVLGRGLWLSGIGLVLGLAASLGLTRVIGTLLYNVNPIDPMTLGIVTVVIAVVAAAACIIPAWRATRVDPLIVLRES